jgi:hypothetical protein
LSVPHNGAIMQHTGNIVTGCLWAQYRICFCIIVVSRGFENRFIARRRKKNNSLKQVSYWEADPTSISQAGMFQRTHLLLLPSHTFLKINFNIIFLLTSRSHKCYPAFKFTIQDFIFNYCPSHQILPDLISLMLFHEDESLWSSSLCMSSFPLSNVTFCLICPTSLFSGLFLDTFNLLRSQSPRLWHHAALYTVKIPWIRPKSIGNVWWEAVMVWFQILSCICLDELRKITTTKNTWGPSILIRHLHNMKQESYPLGCEVCSPLCRSKLYLKSCYTKYSMSMWAQCFDISLNLLVADSNIICEIWGWEY